VINDRAESLGRWPGVELSDDADVVGLGTFLALGGFEGHPLALIQGLETATLDGRVVNEDVLAAAVGGDKLKPFPR
jgi:hypothetical protein